MESTFYHPGYRTDERTDRKNHHKLLGSAITVVDPPAEPSADDTLEMEMPTEGVRPLAAHPREMVTLPQLDLLTFTDDAGNPAPVRLQVGKTPAAFLHLYAGLEKIMNKFGDVSMAAANLLQTDHPYLLGVTSAIAGEGKTTTALHLARTIAHSTPKRVCLIDLSLGDLDLAARVGMPTSGKGIVSAIEDNIDVVPYFNIPDEDSLTVIPAGRAPANPAKFVRLPRIAQFLVATRHAFDVVIVDMPPISSENAVPLARNLDGVMMVVRAGVTPREVVTDAMETVGPDRINCVVLNRTKPSLPQWLQKRFSRV